MSSAAPIAEYLSRLSRINPVDYQDAPTQAHLRAAAAPLDELRHKARAVMLARLIRDAPEDALMLIGRERGIRRYPGEPTETYRTRVLNAWAYWRMAGTLPGVKQALADAGYKATIIEHFRDPDPERWAEFSIALSPLNPIKTPWKWGGGARWGEKGRRWGGLDPNAVPLEYVLDLVREAKPAHARLRRLLYSVHGWYWGGDWQWGQGRDPNDLALGYGLAHGLPNLRLSGSSDSGPTWGGDEAVVLYDLYNEGSL